MVIIIKLKKIIHFLIFSSILGVGVSYSKLYLFHIALALTILAFAAILSQKKDIRIKITPTRLHYFFIFMLGYYILTLIWSINKFSTITYVFYILCGSFLALMVVYYGNEEGNLNRIFKVASFAFGLGIFIALLEVYTPFRWIISPYSPFVELFNKGYLKETIPVFGNAPPTGFHWNPNNLSTTMAIIFPFFLLHRNVRIKWLGIISILLIVSATESRGNILAILSIMLLYFLFYKKSRLLIFIPTLLMMFMFLPNLSTNLQQTPVGSSIAALNKLLNGDSETGDSIYIRRMLVEQGLAALKETYGIGVGGGASNDIQKSGITSMHNFWIEVLVEGGVFFFSVFALWYLTIVIRLLRISYRTRKETLGYYSAASCLAMIGFIPAAISASSTIYLLPMWLLFGFSVAVINTYYAKTKSGYKKMITIY